MSEPTKLEKLHDLLKEYEGKRGPGKRLKMLRAKVEAYKSNTDRYDSNFDYSVLTLTQLDKFKAELLSQIEKAFTDGNYKILENLVFEHLSDAKKTAFRKIQLTTYETDRDAAENDLDTLLNEIVNP